ncbi:hypothetical protein F4804DRAFT_331676 [Jackrogersella minutella]|nr:hypothetical protein F4804DRAFT_331676 [Jackrogersella minutella]
MKNRQKVWEHIEWPANSFSDAAKQWAQKQGIELEWAPTEQHQSNGMAESLNTTIRDKLLPTMIGSTKRKKLDDKAEKGTLVGFKGNSVYRILAKDGIVIDGSQR